ncbi:MAG TPA: hypothetical protein VGA49_03585 [Patescibacteria group bacterium]
MIPLSIFFIIYAIFLLIFLIFAFFSLYHIFKFGFWDFFTYLVTFIFIGGTVIILFITWQSARQIDWSQSLVIFETSQPGSNSLDGLLNP